MQLNISSLTLNYSFWIQLMSVCARDAALSLSADLFNSTSTHHVVLSL